MTEKIIASLLVFPAAIAVAQDRAASTVILDETGVANLRIETIPAEERTFESTIFAIGRVEEIPANHSVVSSRITGRVIEVMAYEGDTVKAGDEIVKVESRVAGNPPPTISLRAPQSGLIVDSHIRVGEPVEPDEELLDISDRSRVWAVAKIPELAASQVSVGTRARIHVPALGDEIFIATLKRYGVEADREAGAVEGIFEMDNAEGRLKPGMRAEFSLITSQRDAVLSIPKIAVQGDPSRRVVFVEDFELPNAFVRVPVVLGEENDTFVEVLKGLFPTDEVVTQGSYGLSFVGAGSSISLKEALDAAHGHEHNEDGSELNEDQQRAKAGGSPSASVGGGAMQTAALAWGGGMTLLVIVLAQRLFNRRKTG